jgi:hypothetical protein
MGTFTPERNVRPRPRDRGTLGSRRHGGPLRRDLQGPPPQHPQLGLPPLRVPREPGHAPPAGGALVARALGWLRGAASALRIPQRRRRPA